MVAHRVAVAALVLLTAAACGSGEDRPGGASASGSVSGSVSASASHAAHEDTKAQFEEDRANTIVHVNAIDFEFRSLPPGVEGPNVLFRVENAGSADHEFVVLGPDAEPVGTLGAFGTGKTKTLAVKLAPGKYVVQCLITEGSKTHAELGMKNDLTVE